MADGIKGAASAIGEAVVKPVVDEVGKSIEQGVKSIVSGTSPIQNQALTSNPSDITQTKLSEQTGLIEARRKIKFWQDLNDAQKKVREKQRTMDYQKKQEVQKKQEIKQFEVQEKKKTEVSIAVKQAQTKTEVRKGVGG